MREFGIFTLVLPVIAPVLVGWLVVWLKLLDIGDAKALSSAYLYIFLPALIVWHLSTQNLAALFDVPFILATASLMLGIYAVLLLIHTSLLHRPLDSSALAAFAASKFNAVVVGLPLLLIAIGRQAIVPVIISLVLGYFTILPLTLVLLEVAKAGQLGRPARLTTVLGRAIRHAALDPLVVAALIGLLAAAIRVSFPEWLAQTLAILGSAAIPVPLVAVGMTISGFSFRENLREVLWISAVRILVAPLLAIGVAKLFALSPLYSVALVISFGLPTAKMAFAIAEDHGVYVRPLAAIVTITTVSMIIVFPLFIWICQHLWPGVIQKHN